MVAITTGIHSLMFQAWNVVELLCYILQVKTEPVPVSTRQRPVSDGVMYGNFNERRIEYEDVLLSERTESQYSQSESYLSER